MLRTATVRSYEGQRPFWGTSYHLEDVPAFSSCCKLSSHLTESLLSSALRLYRRRKGRFEHFADVTLPLVCDFQQRQDERYPVISLEGAIIGEIRLAVSYYESSCSLGDARFMTVSFTMPVRSFAKSSTSTNQEVSRRYTDCISLTCCAGRLTCSLGSAMRKERWSTG